MTAEIVADAATRIFADLGDLQEVNAAIGRGWADRLWTALEENGLTRAWVSENLGGAGLSLAEGFEVISTAGAFALSVPLVETMLAAWLLERAGIAAPAGRISIAPARPQDHILRYANGTLSGIAYCVPFAGQVDYFAALAECEASCEVVLVKADHCGLCIRSNLAGDPQGTVDFQGAAPVSAAAVPTDFDQSRLMQMGCVARSLQIAGALQTILSRSADYANERVAFGRPIGRFQAVQNHLARLAGETAAATTAASSAADAITSAPRWDEGVILEVIAAKIRCAEAASAGAAIAHQVHGAIGLTAEHVLHRLTLRALAWREDFGNESYWAEALGKDLARAGAERLWPLIASR